MFQTIFIFLLALRTFVITSNVQQFRRRGKPILTFPIPKRKELLKMKEKLTTFFDLLSNCEKTVLQISSLIFSAFELIDLLKVLNLLDIKDNENKKFSQNALKLIKDDFIRKGLLQVAPSGAVSCNSLIGDYALRKLASPKLVKEYSTIIKEYFPNTKFHHWSQSKKIIRNARIAFYSEEWLDFQDELANLYAFNPDAYVYANRELLTQLFTAPTQFEILTKVPGAIRKEVLEDCLYPIVLKGEDNLDDYMTLLTHLGKEEDDSIHEAMAKLLFLAGNLSKAKKINAKNPVKIGQLKIEAILLSLEGKTDAAIEVFASTLKEYRKLNGTKKKFFPDITGIYYLLALLKTGNKSYYPEMESIIEGIPYENFYFQSYRAIAAILAFQKNNMREAERLCTTFSFRNWVDKMMCFIARYWVMPNVVKAEEISSFTYEADKSGFMGIATELFAVLAEMDTHYTQIAHHFQQKTGISPFISNIYKAEAWELALDSLENELKLSEPKGTKKSVENSSRLVWLLDFHNSKGLQIEAKEQVLLKNGKWSVGKSVPITRLAEKDEPFYSEQDLRIKNCIKKNLWSGYEFNKDKVLLELVGHPNLYLMQNPNVQIEVVKEPLELYILKASDFYTFKFSIEFENTGIYAKKETPTRYQVIEVNENHLKIVKTLNIKSLRIPVKGEEKLARLLGGLSQYVTIHSDLASENENLPCIEADKRIYIHLLPQGEGFSLELYVKPFGENPPYFEPAKGGENVIANVLNVRTMVKRDLKDEQQRANAVIEACPMLQSKETEEKTFMLQDSEECLQCLYELEQLKKEDKIVIEWPKGEKLKINHYANFDSLSLQIQKENDWFSVSGELSLDDGLVVSVKELLQLVGKKDSPFVELSNGQFLALTKNFQRKLRQLQSISAGDGKKGTRIHPLTAGLMEELTDEVKNISVDKAWKEQVKKLQQIKNFKPELPSNFHADLRPYQQEGYDWLAKLAEWGVGACLADDMGLGKTVQALAVILQRAEKGPTLVIAPVSVCRNWENEARKFTPTMNPIIFREVTDRKAAIETAGPFDLLIVTYGLMQQEAENFINKRFTTIVLDEAQAIKNFATKRSKAAMELQGDFKILTTGTPIENNLLELWNLFNFINPGLLGSLNHFHTQFAIPIERDNDLEKKRSLKRLIKPFILRRKKDEVLDDLPEKTEIVLNVELSDEEKAFYEALRRTAIENIEKSEGAVEDIRFQILAEIMRLRRACCNPRLIWKDSAMESSKLKLFESVVMELIENGHKALVFSQFVDHLSILRELLEKKDISYQYLDGSTPERKRQEAVDAFQRGKGDIFLISLRAGGTGLNLTAADYVIHMDPWWNPAVEDQASDRVHRIGQTRPVTVYRLVTEQTIEEKILQLHATKRDLADSLLEGTDASAKISAQDLLNLLKEK